MDVFIRNKKQTCKNTHTKNNVLMQKKHEFLKKNNSKNASNANKS